MKIIYFSWVKKNLGISEEKINPPKNIKSIIEKIKKITKGGKPEYGKIKFRKDEILKLYPSINKISKIFFFLPYSNL